MNLYLLRHAIAMEREDFNGEDDAQRPLTGDGIKKMRRAAKGMRALHCSFDLILSSPYRRAEQTATIVAQTFATRRRLKFSELLEPERNPKDLIRHLATLDEKQDAVLLVGHEPFLSQLIATLVGARSGEPVKMKKGGLCLLTAEPARVGRAAKLQWFLTPRQLGLLAR